MDTRLFSDFRRVGRSRSHRQLATIQHFVESLPTTRQPMNIIITSSPSRVLDPTFSRLSRQRRRTRSRTPVLISRPASFRATQKTQRCTISEHDMGICICKDKLKIGEQGLRFPCGHVIHYECGRTWLGLNRRCPECRYVI
jgi:hypothetical protein